MTGSDDGRWNGHRPVRHERTGLALILCLHHARRLSKTLGFPFKNREYQIAGEGRGDRLRGGTVTVCEAFDAERPFSSGEMPPGRLQGQPNDGKRVAGAGRTRVSDGGPAREEPIMARHR